MASNEKRSDGTAWAAIVLDDARATVAEIARPAAGKPQVRACETYLREGDDLEVLRRLRGAGRLGRRRCTTLLPAGQYQLLQIDAPAQTEGLPPAERREALRWRIKEMVDFPVEAAGIDLLEIPAPGRHTPLL